MSRSVSSGYLKELALKFKFLIVTKQINNFYSFYSFTKLCLKILNQIKIIEIQNSSRDFGYEQLKYMSILLRSSR